MSPRGIALGAAALVVGLLGCPAVAPAAPLFAPYVDFAGYPPPDLVKLRSQSGAKAITAGFVTAAGGSACTPAWGGYATYPATGAKAYRLANIRAFQKKGGDFIVSFGGQAGTELASACTTVASLTAAYASVVDAYRATRVDFDIEGGALADRAANDRRAQAIAALQRAVRKKGRTLRVIFTLPVLPSGLTPDGVAAVRTAAARGVKVEVVNVMAMDYGDSAAPSPDGRMGTYAVQAATRLYGQLRGVYPRASSAARWAMVGVTPMIGINDVQTEVFTLADAKTLAAFAKARRIGRVSMWQLGRDRQCAKPVTSAQLDCSGVTQPAWQFSRTLG